jgi:uncharacterized delta-60 repeat protein
MPRLLTRLLTVSMTLLAGSMAHADNTTLDPAFGTGGRVNLTFGDYFKTLAHLPRPGGGSVAVVHYRYSANPTVCPADRDCIALYRYNHDGTALPAATVPISINFSTLGGAAIDSQGRIIVVGSIQISGGDYDFRVVRIMPDGAVDSSFAGGQINVAFDLGGNNGDYANAVAVDALDRIVVAGQVQRITTGDTDYGIARINTNGSLDASFDGDGKRQISFDLAATLRIDSATAVVIGSDGKLSIGGLALDGSLSVTRVGLARLNSDGSYDTSFCPTACNFMSTYTGINNGRRVIYYGSDTPARSDSLEAMSLNAAGELLTAGTTPGSGETFGYVQKFNSSGNWTNETTTQGGTGAGGRVYIGGVHWSNGLVVLTGASGPNEEFFFAQRFDAVLAPSPNWGFIGPGNSVYLWSASNGLGDIGDNRPAISSIDPGSRILAGGIYKAAALTDPYSATIARFTYNGTPPGNAIFASGFEN